jgi:multiple sugar transport system permease protein
MRRSRGDARWRGWLFVAPATLYLAVFSLLPIGLAGWLSLHRWHLLKPDRPFLGLANYTALAADSYFVNAVGNTLRFVAYSVPLSVAGALLVALLVAREFRGVGLMRTVLYIPAVCSQVAISMVWTWILMPRDGLINSALGALGLPAGTNFLEAPGWAMAALVAMFAWLGLGPRMILFVAGLQGIPESLREAAALDGCDGWRRLRYVTLPLLRPTTLFVLVTTTIAAFQVFTPVYMLTRGGPQRSTDVILYHVYSEAWQKLEVGMASAMSYVLLAMIIIVSLVQFRILRRGMTEAEIA